MARRGMPSMVALLGLLAFAGYQNRDKIAEMLKGAGGTDPNRPPGSQPGNQSGGLENILSGLGGLIGGTGGSGGSLAGGLGELMERFRQDGKGEIAESWVKPGPNRGLTAAEVEHAVGAENIAELSDRTGMSREELLERLATRIPEGVDELTPEGRFPEDDEEVMQRVAGGSPEAR
jgi:uncharacterized protein YidB (DUF937 family)